MACRAQVLASQSKMQKSGVETERQQHNKWYNRHSFFPNTLIDINGLCGGLFKIFLSSTVIIKKQAKSSTNIIKVVLHYKYEKAW